MKVAVDAMEKPWANLFNRRKRERAVETLDSMLMHLLNWQSRNMEATEKRAKLKEVIDE